ncbi:MAG: RNA polymerase sigma-54 factor, partial [Pseudomonadota bacterium]
MALGPRLDLRQSQQLVMTPQLQQAIKLLAASNLEIETFIGDALETNPLLEAGNISSEAGDGPGEPDDIPREEFTSDQLMAQGQGEGDAPLDIDATALDRDRDTGDAEWGSQISGGGGADGEFLDLEGSRAAELSLAEHLDSQIGAIAVNEKEAFVARHIAGLLDDAGYLAANLQTIAHDLGVSLDEAEDALTVVQMCDPTGVGARDLAECLAIQACEADRYDPCMVALIDNLELLAKGEVGRLKRLCDV